MGGKVWSLQEERIFWRYIIPNSPKRVGIDITNEEKTWSELAKEMAARMGDGARREYTALGLFEHYFQNAVCKRFSPYATKLVQNYLHLDTENIAQSEATSKEPIPHKRPTTRKKPASFQTRSKPSGSKSSTEPAEPAEPTEPASLSNVRGGHARGASSPDLRLTMAAQPPPEGETSTARTNPILGSSLPSNSRRSSHASSVLSISSLVHSDSDVSSQLRVDTEVSTSVYGEEYIEEAPATSHDQGQDGKGSGEENEKDGEDDDLFILQSPRKRNRAD